MGRHYAEHGDFGTERPWRWLAAVARSATDRGEYDLVARVARVALFVTHWASVISPQLAASDEMELRLPKGSRTTAAARSSRRRCGSCPG